MLAEFILGIQLDGVEAAGVVGHVLDVIHEVGVGVAFKSRQAVRVGMEFPAAMLDVEVEVGDGGKPTFNDSRRAIHRPDEAEGIVVRSPTKGVAILEVVPVFCHPVHTCI